MNAKQHDTNTTKACLNHEHAQDELLPPNELVQKWQNSNFLKPGQRVIHPALRHDFPTGHERNLIFGSRKSRKNGESENVEDLFRAVAAQSSSVTRSNLKGRFVGGEDCRVLKQELRELKYYKSAQRGELGRSFQRGHVIPAFMQEETFRHGLKSIESEHDAKALLYPHDDEGKDGSVKSGEDDKEHDDGNKSLKSLNYIKSHGSYLPGQQRKRDYNWPVDPVTTVFGVKGMNVKERCGSKGVSEALHPVWLENKHHTDSNGTSQRGSIAPSNQSNDDEHRVFGKATSTKNETAADCLKCTSDVITKSATAEDDDLGKSVRPGFRNAVTDNRRFGCPSVRTDIPKYNRQSVADTQNYGDDVNAGYLLKPSQCSSLGLDDDEFYKPRSKKYIQTLFQECGYVVSDEEYCAIWAKVDRDIDGKMSIDQYRAAFNEWLSYNKKR